MVDNYSKKMLSKQCYAKIVHKLLFVELFEINCLYLFANFWISKINLCLIDFRGNHSITRYLNILNIAMVQ